MSIGQRKRGHCALHDSRAALSDKSQVAPTCDGDVSRLFDTFTVDGNTKGGIPVSPLIPSPEVLAKEAKFGKKRMCSIFHLRVER